MNKMLKNGKDSPKVYVRCGLPKEQVIGVFAERYINCNVHLDMMESYFFQLEEMDNLDSLYFKLDGAPPQ